MAAEPRPLKTPAAGEQRTREQCRRRKPDEEIEGRVVSSAALAVPLVVRAASGCGYVTRAAIANERPALNRAGEVVLQLKSPYHDETTPVVMSRLELLQTAR